MINTKPDEGDNSNIENSFIFIDEQKIQDEIKNLIGLLEGARKNYISNKLVEQNEAKKDSQNTQENTFCETIEDTAIFNSKEINISYYLIKQLENSLKDYQQKIELLNAKYVQYATQGILEKDIYNLIAKLSQERLKEKKNILEIAKLKNQLKEKWEQLDQKHKSILKDIKDILQPVDNEEVDDDVTVYP